MVVDIASLQMQNIALSSELERWDELWKAIKEMEPELGNANKPLAIAASYALLRADLDVLATVVRTGYEPSANRTWTDEVYRKTAGVAVELHAQLTALRSERAGERDRVLEEAAKVCADKEMEWFDWAKQNDNSEWYRAKSLGAHDCEGAIRSLQSPPDAEGGRYRIACPKCGVNLLEAPCPSSHMDCPMVGKAGFPR